MYNPDNSKCESQKLQQQKGDAETVVGQWWLPFSLNASACIIVFTAADFSLTFHNTTKDLVQ